jgi:tetratricopeptide (TPR) repeat protein
VHENLRADGNESVSFGRAAAALDAVQDEPRAAERLALEVLDNPASPAEQVGALWALGRAQSELDRPDDAVTTLATAAALADDAGFVAVAAEVRVSRSVCLLTTGDALEARADLDRAEPNLAGAPLGRLLMQRALLDLHAGRLTEARQGFDDAQPRLVDDPVATCRLLANRGIVHTYLGDRDRAESDQLACRELALALGQHLAAAAATHNLGYLRGRSGDIPGALEWFGRARDLYEELGMPARLATNLEADLCEVLLAGGLHREAVAAAQRAERAAGDSGNRLAHAEASLLLARAMLAQGDAAAEQVALDAAEAFRRADRMPYAAYAEHVALQAAQAGDTPPEDLLRRAMLLVQPLDEHGWRAEAVEVRTVAGRLALQLGDLATAHAVLGRAASDRATGAAGVRADGWLATAHLRHAEGDRGGARRALQAGIDVVEAHRASLGATELRTRATRHAIDLAAFGLQLAVEDGRPAELLSWAERWHAGTLALAPVRPPRDGRLAGALDELRAAHSAMREATLVGDDTQEAASAVARLERRVRDISRTTAADGVQSAATIDLAALRRALADEGATLIEYVVVGDRLWAVKVSPSRCRAVDLGPFGPVVQDVERVLAALRRLALHGASARSLDAAVASLRHTGTALDRLLIQPLRLPDGPVVVVPTSALQGLAWSVLPSLTARPVTVAPSALVWQRQSLESTDLVSRRAALVAGPGLAHAAREVAEIAALYDDPVTLVDPEATVASVLDAMEGASTLHLAAHGTLRADNPFFTALHTSDGPLTVYDVEHVVRAPTTVVLPACDAGMASVRSGDELVGTAAALVSVGVSTVVAPLTVVSDDSVVAMMVDLHRGLADRGSPAHSLMAARCAALDRGQPGAIAAAHAFVAVGTRGS